MQMSATMKTVETTKDSRIHPKIHLTMDQNDTLDFSDYCKILTTQILMLIHLHLVDKSTLQIRFQEKKVHQALNENIASEVSKVVGMRVEILAYLEQIKSAHHQ